MSLLQSCAGGLLIGGGAALLRLQNGRMAGISGITANAAMGQAGDGLWRVAFLVGLLLPAALVGLDRSLLTASLPWLAVSGVLVGVGTQVGSGCTSGHGVCGIANLSARSFVATATFMAVAMATVAFVRHVLSP
jgi:uncharacterized membrane protein YedE/YeeE